MSAALPIQQTTEDEQPNLVTAIGSDGRVYAIRPMAWNLERMQQAWLKWSNYGILSDDLPKSFEGFYLFVAQNGALWFEVVCPDTKRQIGMIFVNQFALSPVDGTFIQAHFHAVVWDSKALVRRLLVRKFLGYLFDCFGFHRLQSEIPLKFGGAIRALKKIGFVEEGKLRQARRFNGDWYDVLVLGILNHEVTDGRVTPIR